MEGEGHPRTDGLLNAQEARADTVPANAPAKPPLGLPWRHIDETGGAYMSEKPTLSLIAAKETLDLESLRALYINLTGREPTSEELAYARVRLAKVKAEDAAKAKP